jgi:hypothetical protein
LHEFLAFFTPSLFIVIKQDKVVFPQQAFGVETLRQIVGGRHRQGVSRGLTKNEL